MTGYFERKDKEKQLTLDKLHKRVKLLTRIIIATWIASTPLFITDLLGIHIQIAYLAAWALVGINVIAFALLILTFRSRLAFDYRNGDL